MKIFKEEELKKAEENKRMKSKTNLRYRGKCCEP
jgi:hypothetical protein